MVHDIQTIFRGSLFFNDLWGLDLYKQGWVELATRRNPMERAFHSAFVDSQQQMLLLGGVRDTQANPAPADIFKLDLRAGKFFKLGYVHYIYISIMSNILGNKNNCY